MTNPSSSAVLRVRQVLHATILEILPALNPADLDENLHLRELGADSVDRVEIITSVLHQLDLAVPLSLFGDVPNVSALVHKLEELVLAKDAATNATGAANKRDRRTDTFS